MARTVALLLICAAFGLASANVSVDKGSNASPALYVLSSPLDLETDTQPTFQAPQKIDPPQLPKLPELPKDPKDLKDKKDKVAVSGAPTAVSGAPVKKEKKNPIADLVEKKKAAVAALLGKKKDTPAVSGAPVKDANPLKAKLSGPPLKKVDVPIYTLDLKKMGRKL